MHAPAESSRAGHRQNTSARTHERAGSIPLGPLGRVTPPSLPPTATSFACRYNCFCYSSTPLCALLRHARPLFTTPPDAGPALRYGLVVSQVPPRPPSLNYRRARPRCPPCGSALSCRTSISSAYAQAACVPWSALRLACTARVPRPSAPQPLPQLLPRARACALQLRTVAPLPRYYRTRGPGLAAPALALQRAACRPLPHARAATSRQHLPPHPFRRYRASAPSRTTFTRAALHCAQLPLRVVRLHPCRTSVSSAQPALLRTCRATSTSALLLHAASSRCCCLGQSPPEPRSCTALRACPNMAPRSSSRSRVPSGPCCPPTPPGRSRAHTCSRAEPRLLGLRLLAPRAPTQPRAARARVGPLTHAPHGCAALASGSREPPSPAARRPRASPRAPTEPPLQLPLAPCRPGPAPTPALA
jgi:hypothetical protein